MAGNDGGSRVLVVDDLDQMRALIRRLLTTHGYQVDVASTLAEARSMDPGSYDVVIVDANLGADRGTDLIETLLVEDPVAARRCLVITGGSSHTLPAGVPHLAKPFLPGELLAAVRGLGRPGPSQTPPATLPRGPAAKPTEDPATARAEPTEDPATARAEPTEDPATARAERPAGTTPRDHAATPAPPAGEAISVWRLLAITRRRRGREGEALADFLHDGPIQQLAAATLALHMLRGPAPPSLAEGLDEVLRELNAAARSLRWLIDSHWQPVSGPGGPVAALRQRAAWLLAEPLALDIHGAEGLGAAEVGVMVDVVELMLIAAVPAGVPAKARATVVTSDSEIEIKLAVTPPADDPGASDAAPAQAALSELACALGADVHAEFASEEWQARIVMPRQHIPGKI